MPTMASRIRLEVKGQKAQILMLRRLLLRPLPQLIHLLHPRQPLHRVRLQQVQAQPQVQALRDQQKPETLSGLVLDIKKALSPLQVSELFLS